jgi:hypothetical protein
MKSLWSVTAARGRAVFTRRRAAAVTAALALASVVTNIAAVPRASANLAGSNFESNDANLAVDTAGNMDWNGFAPVTWTGTAPYRQSAATVGGWTFTGLEDAVKSSKDTGFAGGTKQDANCPTVIGTSSPNKDDMARVYLATKTINGHVFLSLAWARVPLNSTDSSTHLAFEFNQGNNGACPATSKGLVSRSTANGGDMLILYDFAGGTATPTIGLERWVASGACAIGSDSPPCWGTETTPLPATVAEAAVDTGAGGLPSSAIDCVAPPGGEPQTCTTKTGGTSLGLLQFGEAGLDLTNAGVFNSNQCLGFGSAWAVSRSSGNSGNAQMEDLVGPGSINLSNCFTKTFTLTFSSTTPPIAGTTVWAVYSTTDSSGTVTIHNLQLTQNGSTYTGSDPSIHPGTTLTNVHLEIRNANGVVWSSPTTSSETISQNTTNTGTFSYALALSPSNPTNFVGKSETFTATLTGSGTFNGASNSNVPLPGVTVNFATFNGTPSGCGTLSTTSSTTGSAGTATTTLSSATACTTSIRAWVNSVGGTSGFDAGEVSATDSKTFEDFNLTVSPSSATNALGSTSHTFTITLTRNTGAGFVGYGGQTVHYCLSGSSTSCTATTDGAYVISVTDQTGTTTTGNQSTTSGTCTTTSSGTCTVVTNAPNTGTFYLYASYTRLNDSGSGTFTGSGGKTYVTFRVTVTPSSATNIVNVAHTFTVELDEDSGSGFHAVGAGFPLSLTLTQPTGDDAHFTMINGSPASGTTSSCTTNASGQCSVTIVASKTGTVTLTATYAFTNSDNATVTHFSGTGTKQYVNFTLSVTPPAPVNQINVPETFTVTLQEDTGSGFAAASGKTLTLSLANGGGADGAFTSINGAPASGTTGTCTTDGSGQCSVTIVSDKPGTVTLTASYAFTNSDGSVTNFSVPDTKTYVNVTLTKTPCVGSIPPNGVLLYTISWSVPTGQSLSNAVLTDQLPSGLLYDAAATSPTPNSAPANGTNGPAPVVWNLGNLSAGSGSVTLGTTVDPTNPPSSIVNHATLTATGGYTQTISSTPVSVGTVGAGASGEAYGASVTLLGTQLPGTPTPDVTNGASQLTNVALPPPPSTPNVTASLLAVSNTPSVTGNGAEDNASATAGTVDVELPNVSVTADAVVARSDSTASGTTATTSTDGSEVVGLRINGSAAQNYSTPQVIPVVNALGVEVAEVDVLEHTGASGAALGGAAGAQPQGGLFSSGLTVNGLHVKALSSGTTTVAEAVVSRAKSLAAFPTITPCSGSGPYVVGDAKIVDETLTYPTGPTTAVEGEVVLPSTGGDVPSTTNTLSVPGLVTSGTGTTETKGALSPLNANSTATVQNLAIGGTALTASAISSSATANPSSIPPLSGSTTILSLAIQGVTSDACQTLGLTKAPKPCTPAPNTVLPVPGAPVLVMLNEQITDTAGKIITVNAVHIWIIGQGNPFGLPVGSDLIISGSTAGTS